MRKKNFTFLFLPLFFIAVAFTSGCSALIGGLDENEGTASNYLIAMPIRFLYEYNDNFVPKDGVEVVGIFGGVKETINIEDVEEIKIKNDFSGKEDLITKSTYPDGFPLESNIGVNTVYISCRGLKTFYSIHVKDKNGGGGPGEPGGPSITIDWVWRPK